MEALNFLRFWKLSYGVQKVNQTHTEATSKSIIVSVSDHELDEGDDSFIDLEFPLHELNDNVNKEHGSRRKIKPIEPISKPQSPIALLKSAPKFRVFTPKRSNSVANTCVTETPKHERQGTSKRFTRENSLRRTMKGQTEGSFVDDSSKRLSKDLVQKYLNVIKPLYARISKKNSQISGEFPLSSPAASPAKQRNRSTGIYYKHLGKSKSSSAAASPINRRDDSLLLQHDGIQSAILHCKRSFNSSRESSWLSRCTSDSSQEKLSDSSQEKLSNASSTDSSILSRVTSNSSYDKLIDSARPSSDEGNGFNT